LLVAVVVIVVVLICRFFFFFSGPVLFSIFSSAPHTQGRLASFFVRPRSLLLLLLPPPQILENRAAPNKPYATKYVRLLLLFVAESLNE
jgi:hypothetical protein